MYLCVLPDHEVNLHNMLSALDPRVRLSVHSDTSSALHVVDQQPRRPSPSKPSPPPDGLPC